MATRGNHTICGGIKAIERYEENIELFSNASSFEQRLRKGDAHIYHYFRELNNLREVVTKISRRGRFARFLLHDADIQAITACTTSIKAVYDKLGVGSHSIPGLNLTNGVK